MNLGTIAANYFAPPVQAVRSCRAVRRFAIWTLLLCSVGQLLIDPSGTNVVSVLIVATISAATFHFILRGEVFRALPLPALIVLGFNISSMSGALIAQTLSMRSLVYNLQVPLITFALCALFQISLLVALFIFLSSSSIRAKIRTINRRVFSRMGIMRAPAPLQLWLMGFIGSAAMLWSVSGSQAQFGDVGAKFLQGFYYLAFAPFLLPILDNVFPQIRASSNAKSSKWLLIGYMLLLVFIAMVRNSRGTFMIGITNLGIAAFLLMLLGQLRVTARLRRGLAIGAVMALMVAPIVADLAIAMVVVRGERSEVSGTQLVTLTLTAYNDKAALEQYRKGMALVAGFSHYDEAYLTNPFVARFVNTKYFDNTLSYKDVRTGDRAAKLWSITLDKIGAFLPTPVLKGLGIDIKKENIQFSMGDALYYAQTGTGLGGFRVGSSIGHGMALMGYLLFIAAVPLFLLTFMAVQSLTLAVGTFVVISPVIFLQLQAVFGLATNDSLLAPIGMMLRGLPQDIFIYWLVFHATRWAGELRHRRRLSVWAPGPVDVVRHIGNSDIFMAGQSRP